MVLLSLQVGNSAVFGSADGGQSDRACEGQGGTHEAGVPPTYT